MQREIKHFEDYRKASNENLASVVRSISEVNQSLTEFSKNAFSRAIEMQAQFSKRAYESYISEASKLGQMFLIGFGKFVARTEDHGRFTNERSIGDKSGAQRTAAHRVATKRKTGVAKRRGSVKRSTKAKR